MSEQRLVSVEEIRKHASETSCWLVIDGMIWDLTEFAPEHPGGGGLIYKHAGRDATEPYNSVHVPSLIKDNLSSSKLIGRLDTSTIDEEWKKLEQSTNTSAEIAEQNPSEKPPLETLVNTFDFEDIGSRFLTKKTWAFYSSAATGCVTRESNRSFFDRIWFRPRLLRNVKDVSTKTTVLGQELEMPVFVSPAALAKLAHPDGECALARGCEKMGAMQMISNNASFPAADIIRSTSPNHKSFFQLYMNKDRAKTEKLLKHIVTLKKDGLAGIVLTVDAAVAGKREADERIKADESLNSPNSGASAKNDKKGGGIGRVMGSYIDSSLSWSDIAWVRSLTGPDMPLLLKGIQSSADAKKALSLSPAGQISGLVIGNHGGRSLDTSPPSVLILLELRKHCPEIFSKMDILVDGGIRRGTDILKCICLGAKAVGLGRPALYSLLYGQEGVEHILEILKDELETSMRLTGLTDLKMASESYVNTRDLDYLVPEEMQTDEVDGSEGGVLGWFRSRL